MTTRLLFTSLLLACSASLNAQTLYPNFLNPGFVSPTEYSEWDVFYAPNGGLNYPDVAAPFGSYQSRTAAGFAADSDYNPTDPLARWHTNNPTIQQTAGGALIIGPGTAGNIYSFSNATTFRLSDVTPFVANTVVYQIATEGTTPDFSTLVLRYGTGYNTVLNPTSLTEEYRSAGGPFGGLGTRAAAQWDLTGLGITDYRIEFTSAGSSLSFQRAILDTANETKVVVPLSRTWDGGGGNASWSTAANWSSDALPATGSNVAIGGSVGSVILDGVSPEVGYLTLNSSNNLTLTRSAAEVMKINTGITSNSTGPRTHTINVPIVANNTGIMDIAADNALIINGTFDAPFGLLKIGTGKMALNGVLSGAGGLAVEGGDVELNAANTYTGSTRVTEGKIIVKTSSAHGTAGALGNATTNVSLGSGGTFSADSAIVIDGDHDIGRNIALTAGGDAKVLGAQNTPSGATYSGNISLTATSSNVQLQAVAATDRVTFSGAISGGAVNQTLLKNGAGTVVYSGTNKTYLNSTTITAGTLLIAAGTSSTGNGAWNVSSGTHLQVNGTLSGTGALVIAGGKLSGSGTVNKAVTIDAGDILSPGNSPGTMSFVGNQTWGEAGTYLWEINDVNAGAGSDPGWDLDSITGSLTITATNSNKFNLNITSLTLANLAGDVHDFNDLTSYSWKIAQTTAGIAGFAVDKFNINVTAFSNSETGTFNISQSGNDLFLNYAAIPEPSTYLLVAFSCAAIVIATRRRKGITAG